MIDPALRDILDRGLLIDPSLRRSDACAVVRELMAWARELGAHAEPVGTEPAAAVAPDEIDTKVMTAADLQRQLQPGPAPPPEFKRPPRRREPQPRIPAPQKHGRPQRSLPRPVASPRGVGRHRRPRLRSAPPSLHRRRRRR